MAVTAYTRNDIVADLAWVEGRIAEWTAEGGWVESVAKYQACADELRALLESDAYRPARTES